MKKCKPSLSGSYTVAFSHFVLAGSAGPGGGDCSCDYICEHFLSSLGVTFFMGCVILPIHQETQGGSWHKEVMIQSSLQGLTIINIT